VRVIRFGRTRGPKGRRPTQRIRRPARKPVWHLLLSLALLSPALAACGRDRLTVSFFGDSELDHSKADVIAAQNAHIVTTIYAEPGCGLMVDGYIDDARHRHYCNRSRNSTQANVDRFWRNKIAYAESHERPRYVQVELGLNDAGWHSTAELVNYKDRVKRFVSLLPASTRVLWDNLPDMNPADKPKFDAIDRALNDAAAETPNLHIVDVRSVFAGRWPKWYLPNDPTHFNDTGQYEFARVNCLALVAQSANKIDSNCDPRHTNAATRSTSP
jgi:GDSL-like Lipase/Acylhydrolase family